MVRLPVLTFLLASIAGAAGAEDWPQFRGPTGQGHSSERGVPLEWSETVNVLWKTRVPGSGWSSPVVAGGRVWVTSADQGPGPSSRVSLRALAFDSGTGREVVNVERRRVVAVHGVARPQHATVLVLDRSGHPCSLADPASRHRGAHFHP